MNLLRYCLGEQRVPLVGAQTLAFARGGVVRGDYNGLTTYLGGGCVVRGGGWAPPGGGWTAGGGCTGRGGTAGV
jgi:hypothetical protein